MNTIYNSNILDIPPFSGEERGRVITKNNSKYRLMVAFLTSQTLTQFPLDYTNKLKFSLFNLE